MKVVNKMILSIFSVLVFLFVMFNFDTITDRLAHLLQKDPELVILPTNQYQKNDSFQFVSISKDYKPYSYQELINVIYTFLNNGWETFTFYCPKEYLDCISDITKISDDQELLTHINNFVHPFNSFIDFTTTWTDSGEITLKINKFYTASEIKAIDQKVDQILNDIVKEDMDEEEKIKVIHDYIINHTKYDIKRNNDGDSSYHSNTAYGPLFEGYAICNGYTDAMALFLSKLNIPNYKIATNNTLDEKGHIWNAVKINDKWLHLDLTWDDPVSDDGKDYLRHKYFLITNKELKAADAGETQIFDHEFKSSIYQEFKGKEA